MCSSATDRLFFENPRSFLELVHRGGAGWGNIGWARRLNGQFEHHQPRPFAEVAVAMEQLAGADDVYLTLNRFRRRYRSAESVGQLAALHLDIDWYKLLPPATLGQHAAQLVLAELNEAGVPPPSFILGTGRGSLAVWLIEPVPAKIKGQKACGPIRRWRAMQDRLCAALAPLGSDSSQLHPAALCRVPGTKNGKNGAPVKLLWKPAGSIYFYNFEELAAEILPPRPAKPFPRLRSKGTAGRRQPPSNRGPAQLHRERLAELMRWAHSYTQIPDGARDYFIFCAAVSLSWTVDPEILQPSIIGFAREAGLLDIPGWSPERVRQVTGTVVRRTLSKAQGHGGTRYKLRGERIVELLGITAAQAKDLDFAQLDPNSERKKQRSLEAVRQRQEEHRRRQGSVPREEYLESSFTRSRPWEALKISRSTWYKRGLHRQSHTLTERARRVA